MASTAMDVSIVGKHRTAIAFDFRFPLGTVYPMTEVFCILDRGIVPRV